VLFADEYDGRAGKRIETTTAVPKDKDLAQRVGIGNEHAPHPVLFTSASSGHRGKGNDCDPEQ
jgi:hypothetical protein